jgi:putative transposase
MDHGPEYESHHTIAICTALGIQTPFIPYHSPESKPHIEIFQRTLAYSLFEEVGGFCGHNIVERKALESRFLKHGGVVKVPVTAEKLQEIIDSWILNKYEQTIHRGINARPIEKAASSMKPLRYIKNKHVLDLLLAPVGQAVVQKKGIQFRGGWYVEETLVDCIGRPVEIREDLQDAGQIYVFAKDGRFLCIAKDRALRGFTREELRKLRKDQKRAVRQATKALGELAQVPDSPMEAHLDRLEQAPGKIRPLIRREKVDLPAVKEAVRAVEAHEGAATDCQQAEEAQALPDSDGLFYGPGFEFRQYEYLIEKRKTTELTDREKGIVEEFERSPAFRFYEDEAIGGAT